MTSANPLDFPGYQEKIEKTNKTDLSEAVVTGTAKLDGVQFGVAVMDARFRMGSMGSVVGEKICRIIDYATEHRLPFILFSASGARMQEGIISLMQMGKTSVSLKRHSDAGLLYISYLTHPTTGGVSSFASVGDINLSEPKALDLLVDVLLSKLLMRNFQMISKLQNFFLSMVNLIKLFTVKR